MNIRTVRDNLKNTIAGKEALLESYENNSTTFFSDSEKMVMIAMIAINLTELKKILADVELCMNHADANSWITNPDRMGGQFTQDEIDESTRWR